MYITLKRLEHSEINLLRVLRNAYGKRFFTHKHITEAEQERWWDRYVNDLSLNPVSRVLFVKNAKGNGQLIIYTIWLNKVTPVGFLSVNRMTSFKISNDPWKLADICELGHILLAPDHRGRGIMHAALTEVRRLYDPLTFWVAHVKADNEASLNLFARHGFIQYERSTKRRSSKCRSSRTSKKSTKPSSPTSSSSLAAISSRTR